MAVNRRQDQLGQVITHELSDLMRLRMKDPRIGFVSITAVEVTKDLSYAKVYVSVMGSPEEQRDTMRALHHAAGFLRHELAQRLTIRHVPELTFQLDESIARGARVIELLNQVSGNATGATPAPPTERQD
ncbi:MAG TPA: 30S ribosome-binding factor RbfA [Ktedonobacterales bacterium]